MDPDDAINNEATPPTFKKSNNENKRSNSIENASGVTTRNWARKARIQTRAMSTNSKPSVALLAAKKKAQQKKRSSFETILRDHFQTAMDSKNVIKGPVEYVTEKRMLEHECLWDPNYPECPNRLSCIIERCEELELTKRCKVIEPRFATKDEVLQLHSPEVYDLLFSTHKSTDVARLEDISAKYDAVYIHPSTHELALMAAGSTIQVVEDVVKGEAGSGIALVRPPGHHAMKDEPCGYCFYNNVALAAHHAITNLKLSRVLIVDWDVHHGQASQQMFYDDPRVVYFSTHRYEHGSFWPNLRQSDFNYIGTGEGTGYNFNIPLNKTKMQDADFIAIWHQVLMPMALEGEMEITPACYAHLTHLLMGVCSSIVVVLEGGYCLSSLSESAALTLRTLLGDPVPPMCPLTAPCQSIKDSILNCIYTHKAYWNCFNYQPTYSLHSTVLNVSDANKEKHVVETKWLGDETRPDKFATRDCYPLQDQAFLDDVRNKLSHLKIVTDLSVPKHRVCYVYGDAMMKHKNIHEDHPERPERISRIYSRFCDWKLINRMLQITPRAATREELELAHTPDLSKLYQSLTSMSVPALRSQQEKYESIYFHNDSYLSASIAAGSVLQVLDAVLDGEAGSGVCIIRPPGHHASEDMPCGFCLFNNVGVAAKYAISSHSLKRILIVDWDVHHGNGTQSMFINDPRVLYISLHRYDHGTFFPSSEEGNYTVVGNSAGCGFNVNIPWNKRGMGDREYIAAFTQIVLPIAYEYNPELVLISAGFDACVGDPLGGCKVTPECFGRLTHWLSGLARGKVILCLEGGYNVTSISYSMAMCTKALLGDPIMSNYESRGPPHSSAVETINDVISVHKKYWKNLSFQVALPQENVLATPTPSRGLTVVNKNTDICDKIANMQINADTNVSNDYSDINNSSSDISDDKLDGNKNSSINEAMSCDMATASGSKPQNKETLTVFLESNMEALLNEDMYAVIPLKYCPHLESLTGSAEAADFKHGRKCTNCDHSDEIWVCLDCKIPACARYINGHMIEHGVSSNHPLVLSLVDHSVWCSVCEAYVDNALLYPYKNAAHIAKFGEEMPWIYESV